MPALGRTTSTPDLALTASTLTTGEVTVEIARRQPDGSWLWAVDESALVP